MKHVAAIILAAGKGTRMRSVMPKALFEIAGKKMAGFLLDAVRKAGIEKVVFVGGYKIGMLKRFLSWHKADIVEQKQLLGSADAVKQTADFFKDFRGTVVVLYVDTPLIKASTIRRMVRAHLAGHADLTLLTADLTDAKEYGRIARDEKGAVCKIVEHTEHDGVSRLPSAEINVGVYCFNAGKLFDGLGFIKKNSKKKEYYLTDIVSYFYKKDYRILSHKTKDKEEALGVNSRPDIIAADEIIRRRALMRIIGNGVTIIDPSKTYIAEDVRIGKDTIIYPFVVIEKDVIIGPGCKVGPFANLRSGTVLKKGSQVGNYVEVTRSQIGSYSRVKHHSYIGDTSIGRDANIGAGTITANYDGRNKNRTIIGNSAFIGSGTILVAPVRIGRKSVTGAGSVVVKGRDIPDNAIVAGVPARPLLRKGKGMRKAGQKKTKSNEERKK
jgi:bifunctional UDP-N-acetylglucosamine pyrophosphorylase / glucosamine-1-phosphate N-acetyltransferase